MHSMEGMGDELIDGIVLAVPKSGGCMEVAFLVGRIIVGLYYINGGLRHFTHLNMMAGYAGSKGVPVPKVAVPASGALLALGGLSILIGYQPLIGVIAI